MNKCKNCGNMNYSTLVIFTETTFGHGDSTHECYVKCTECGNRSKSVSGWGVFQADSFRSAQKNWNNENETNNDTI